MGILHYSRSIIQRSKGSSATKATAYIIGEKIHDDSVGLTYNYSHKEEVVACGLEAPEQFPEELRGFSELSSAIERSEKSSKAQLAVRGNVALPACNTLEENIALVQEHIKPWKEQGFAVIWGVHMKDGNPHFHYLIPQRRVEMNEDGSWKWAAKARKEYKIQIDGVVQKEYVTPAQFKELKESGIDVEKIKGGKDGKPLSRKQNVGFDSSKEALLADRKRWAENYNKSTADHYANLGIDNPEEPVSHLSYKDQGIDKIPQKHEGPFPSAEILKYNKAVREYNSFWDKANKIIEEIKEVVQYWWNGIKPSPLVINRRSHISQDRTRALLAYAKRQTVSIDQTPQKEADIGSQRPEKTTVSEKVQTPKDVQAERQAKEVSTPSVTENRSQSEESFSLDSEARHMSRAQNIRGKSDNQEQTQNNPNR